MANTVADEHAENDRRLGRNWNCNCDSCRAARLAGYVPRVSRGDGLLGRIIICMACMGMVLGVLIACFSIILAPPRYHGRPLKEWISEVRHSTKSATRNQAIQVLIEVLREGKDENARAMAAASLMNADWNDQDVIRALAHAIKNDRPVVKKVALVSLASISNDPRIVALIIGAAWDSDLGVVHAAAFALKCCKVIDKDAVPDLIQLMKHPQASIRRLAIETIVGKADCGKEVLPKIRECENDANEDVREAVRKAEAILLMRPDM